MVAEIDTMRRIDRMEFIIEDLKNDQGVDTLSAFESLHTTVDTIRSAARDVR